MRVSSLNFFLHHRLYFLPNFLFASSPRERASWSQLQPQEADSSFHCHYVMMMMMTTTMMLVMMTRRRKRRSNGIIIMIIISSSSSSKSRSRSNTSSITSSRRRRRSSNGSSIFIISDEPFCYLEHPLFSHFILLQIRLDFSCRVHR